MFNKQYQIRPNPEYSEYTDKQLRGIKKDITSELTYRKESRQITKWRKAHIVERKKYRKVLSALIKDGYTVDEIFAVSIPPYDDAEEGKHKICRDDIRLLRKVDKGEIKLEDIPEEYDENEVI